MNRIPLFSLILTLILSASVWAGNADLNSAKTFIKKGEFAKAKPHLQKIVKKKMVTSIGAEASVLLMETGLATNDLKVVRNQLRRFLKVHGLSEYRERAIWVRARLKLLDGQVISAAQEMTELLKITQSAKIFQEVRAQLKTIISSNVLSARELSLLSDEGIVDKELSARVYYSLAEKLEKEGRIKGARFYWIKLGYQIPECQFKDEARSRLEKLQGKGNGIPVILVAAPLTGRKGKFGNLMLQGAILAIEESGQKIAYRAVDTEGDPAVAVNAVRSAFEEENVAAVLGPIMSPVAASLGAWMSTQYPGIPMISPTATAEGLGELGDNIFQLNVPVKLLARRLAQHAVQCQKLRDFVVIHPRTSYGEIMSSAFIQEVQKLGGVIFASSSYAKGLPDYRKMFETLRLRAYDKQKINKKIAWGGADSTSKHRMSIPRDWDEMVVDVGGLFVAATSPKEALSMLQHAAHAKLEGRLLGGSGWYGKAILGGGNKPANEGVFVSPYLERNELELWKNFKASFGRRWGATPDKSRVAALSFDATRLLLTALKSGSAILDYLNNGKTFAGVLGNVSLTENGSNSEAFLVQVRDRSFNQLEKCEDAKFEPKKPRK